MIKKIYEKPEIKVVTLSPISIICTSGPTRIPVDPNTEMEEDEGFE